MRLYKLLLVLGLVCSNNIYANDKFAFDELELLEENKDIDLSELEEEISQNYSVDTDTNKFSASIKSDEIAMQDKKISPKKQQETNVSLDVNFLKETIFKKTLETFGLKMNHALLLHFCQSPNGSSKLEALNQDIQKLIIEEISQINVNEFKKINVHPNMVLYELESMFKGYLHGFLLGLQTNVQFLPKNYCEEIKKNIK